MPARNKRTRKKDGSRKKGIPRGGRKKGISGGGRFKTTSLEVAPTRQELSPSPSENPFRIPAVEEPIAASGQSPIKLRGYPSFALEEPQEEVIDDEWFENYGRVLGRRQVPQSLFQEISQDPNIESIRKLEREYKDIKKELERLKQKVYLDHQYQFELIMELLR